MTPRRLLVLLAWGAVPLLGLTGLGAWALWNWQHDAVVWIMLGEGLIYAAVVRLLGRHEALLRGLWRRRALLLILGTAVVSRALIIGAPPVSTDIYRYVWDGRVQAAGINPYRHRPADPQLAFLRDEDIYPNINRAETALTIYPPAAQLLFRAVDGIGANVTLMKLAMVVGEAILVGAALALLRLRGLPETRILRYVWHPLPLFEFAGSGHIDAAALGLMLLACLLAERRRPGLAGAMLGVAALMKFFPLVIVPALYRRWDWRLPVGFALVATALYLPFLGVGRQVLGFMPGYLQEEGMTSGNGFFLLEALERIMPLPGWAAAAYGIAGVMLLGAAALAVVWRASPAISLTSALWLLVGFTLFLSPHLAWYFTWGVPFLCFRLSWALVYLSSISPLLYRIIWEPGEALLQAVLYVPFAVILLIELARGPHRPDTEPCHDGTLAARHAD